MNEIDELENTDYLDFDGGEQDDRADVVQRLSKRILAAIAESHQGSSEEKTSGEKECICGEHFRMWLCPIHGGSSGKGWTPEDGPSSKVGQPSEPWTPDTVQDFFSADWRPSLERVANSHNAEVAALELRIECANNLVLGHNHAWNDLAKLLGVKCWSIQQPRFVSDEVVALKAKLEEAERRSLKLYSDWQNSETARATLDIALSKQTEALEKIVVNEQELSPAAWSKTESIARVALALAKPDQGAPEPSTK